MSKYKRENNGLQMNYFKDSSLSLLVCKLLWSYLSVVLPRWSWNLQPIIIFLKYQTKVEDKSRAPNQTVLYRVTSKNKKNLGQISGKTSAGNVPENVFEMLWIFYYGNYLWMHACVTCGCDKDWVTVCCCVVFDHVYVRWYFSRLWLW